MAANKHIGLDRKESLLRVLFAAGTFAASYLAVTMMTTPGDLDAAQHLVFEFEAKKILILMLYGIFALWVGAHLDVIGDRLLDAPAGRVAALRLGLAGRAFTHCGAWSRGLRWRVWRTLEPRLKPRLLRDILRSARGAYVFGLVQSFLLMNVIFPDVVVLATGFGAGFVRLFFAFLMIGIFMVSGQNSTQKTHVKCRAICVVLVSNLVAAFALFVLISGQVSVSFGVLAVAMIFVQGLGWALRVPFALGIMEVVLLSLCPQGEMAAMLAACALFHIFFQGPALITAHWIAFSPKLASPFLLSEVRAKA